MLIRLNLVVTMTLAFLATVLTGGRRFAHVERLRSDEVIRTILGVKRLPSAMTLSRYFGAFVRSQIKHRRRCWASSRGRACQRRHSGEVLDLDSTWPRIRSTMSESRCPGRVCGHAQHLAPGSSYNTAHRAWQW
jgi:hypothetical protein